MADDRHILCEARIRELEAERDLAIAHDRQPYPTAAAYEAVCRALNKHRGRADDLEKALEAVQISRDLNKRLADGAQLILERAAAEARREALIEAEEACRNAGSVEGMRAVRALSRWDGQTPFEGECQ